MHRFTCHYVVSVEKSSSWILGSGLEPPRPRRPLAFVQPCPMGVTPLNSWELNPQPAVCRSDALTITPSCHTYLWEESHNVNNNSLPDKLYVCVCVRMCRKLYKQHHFAEAYTCGSKAMKIYSGHDRANKFVAKIRDIVCKLPAYC